jgi:molybdenum cofactor biosynthesis enzyme MoaA
MNNITGIRIIGTYKFNSNCPFCYQKHKEGVFLTPSNALLALSNVTDVEYMTFMGGELSDYPTKTIELLNTIIPLNKAQQYNLTTNGKGDISFYNDCINLGITNINISMPNFKNDDILFKIKELQNRCNVRLNVFMSRMGNFSTYYDIINFASSSNIGLTFCEDMKDIPIETSIFSKIIDEPYSIEQHQTYNVFTLTRNNFNFWSFHHDETHDNLIILPNGTSTLEFNDVINGKGHLCLS